MAAKKDSIIPAKVESRVVRTQDAGSPPTRGRRNYCHESSVIGRCLVARRDLHRLLAGRCNSYIRSTEQAGVLAAAQRRSSLAAGTNKQQIPKRARVAISESLTELSSWRRLSALPAR